MTVIERIEQAARETFGPFFLNLTTRPQRLKFARRVRTLLAEQKQQELEAVIDPLFDAFWAAYPRQVDCLDALRAWRALRPGPRAGRLHHRGDQGADREGRLRRRRPVHPVPVHLAARRALDRRGVAVRVDIHPSIPLLFAREGAR